MQKGDVMIFSGTNGEETFIFKRRTPTPGFIASVEFSNTLFLARGKPIQKHYALSKCRMATQEEVKAYKEKIRRSIYSNYLEMILKKFKLTIGG